MGADPEAELTVEQLLDEARAKLDRLTPAQANAAHHEGRSWSTSARSCSAPGRRAAGRKRFARNVFEWRLDPSSPHRDPEAARREVQLIVVCNEGYQSSLAAATLQRFGLQATDVIGGFQAWQGAGLPIAHD